jgi:AraC-like DNA-binding protein
MDVLSEVLRTVRLTGATFFNAEFRKPWGFTSPAMETLAPTFESPRRHVVLYHLVMDGHATVRLDDGPNVALAPGDVVVVPHGHAHRMWHGRSFRWFDTAPAVRRALNADLAVTRAGGTGASTRFVCGYFSCEPRAEHLFLAGLPPLMKVSLRDGGAGSWLEDAIRFLSAEASSAHPGRVALLAKLSEALFIETLRRFMMALPEHETGWVAGARDAVTGHALALIHRDPAERWTVESLARKVGTSRSTLVERFSHFLHEPPITYLAHWRLQLGARLLETTQRSILEVAGDVGYESEAAFNRAFKRKFGLPPGRYRRSQSSTARREANRA